MKNTAHGGNIYKKAKELGIDTEQILDFSANISPLGIPAPIKEAMIASLDGTINYPDPECTALREAIAGQHGIQPSHIACGNGGADLLYRLAFGLKPRKVLLPVPAFVEYEEALRAAGAEMVYAPMGEEMRIPQKIEDQITEDIDLLILCNPNNPTGLLTSRTQILDIIKRAQQVQCRVMIDECFLEICQEEEEYSVIPYLETYSNLMVLKSFTKLYAIPGVRLGYLLSGEEQVIEKVNRAGQAWSVSHIAQCAGVAALQLTEYKREVIHVVAEELSYMKEELEKLPLRVYDGKANYLFFRAPGVSDLDKRLENFGIMIRNCSNYVNLGTDYWRVAVKSHEENKKLIEGLKKVL